MMRILFLTIFLGLSCLTITTAQAQSTAGAYCATISGCEVIAINLIDTVVNGSNVVGIGNVEYCRGNRYKVRPFASSTSGNGTGGTYFYFSDYAYGSYALSTPDYLDATNLCTANSANSPSTKILP